MPSLKLISATDTLYSAAILKSLDEQRSIGLFCDVTIIVQDKKFRAHKTILSASSTYFHQLFSVAGQVIELNFIRPEIFEQILNYIYSSRIVRVRSDMLEELIQAGQVLGVKFIANLGSPLSQVKGIPGLSKETDAKNDGCNEVLPVITESFSISSEEFNQNEKKAGKEEDSDCDVVFVSRTDAQTRAAGGEVSEVIDLDKLDVENASEVDGNTLGKGEPSTPTTNCAAAPTSSCPKSRAPISSPLRSPDSSSHSSSPLVVSSRSAPSTPAGARSFTPEPSSSSQPFDNTDIMGVHKKQVSTLFQEGDVKIRLLDVSDVSSPQDAPKAANGAKQTVTIDTATEMDSLSTGCKVYANIGEDTYDIVPVKEDPGEGGSNASGGKRSLMATPLKPFDKLPLTEPNKKKSKTELEDHYEVVMDGKTFFVCVVCKRPYVCLTSLRRHFNTHSWEKKYPCRHCNKVFALAEYRTKHEILHTGERRYQCLLCNDTFLNYQLLSSHCKQAHNQDPSGKKEKDDSDNNLYRLLPSRKKMKSYSWVTDEPMVPVINDDGGLPHISTVGEAMNPSTQGRVLTWDELFKANVPPDAQPGSNMSSPPQGATEFEYITPETY